MSSWRNQGPSRRTSDPEHYNGRLGRFWTHLSHGLRCSSERSGGDDADSAGRLRFQLILGYLNHPIGHLQTERRVNLWFCKREPSVLQSAAKTENRNPSAWPVRRCSRCGTGTERRGRWRQPGGRWWWWPPTVHPSRQLLLQKQRVQNEFILHTVFRCECSSHRHQDDDILCSEPPCWNRTEISFIVTQFSIKVRRITAESRSVKNIHIKDKIKKNSLQHTT